MLRYVWRVPAGALAALVLGAACAEEPPPPEPVVRPIKMRTLGEADWSGVFEYVGAVKPAQTAEMAFEVPGRIVEFNVTEGERVLEGQILARLDDRDYKNELDAALAELERAQSFRDRVQSASASGAVSAQDLTDAQARFDAAQAQVNIKQKAYDETFLRAPFAGEMAEKLVEDFQNVRAKQTVLVLQDDSYLELKVSVPESDLRIARPEGTENLDNIEEETEELYDIQVIVSAFPDRSFPADLTEFATRADPTTRTFEMTLRFENPRDIVVLSGMTARAILRPEVGSDREGFALPVSAVAGRNDGSPFVWLVDESSMTVSKRPVSIGELSGSSINVSGGLSTGDVVALSGVAELRDGMEVSRLEPYGSRVR